MPICDHSGAMFGAMTVWIDVTVCVQRTSQATIDASQGLSEGDVSLLMAVPVVVAAGGGGAGASDYCCGCDVACMPRCVWPPRMGYVSADGECRR